MIDLRNLTVIYKGQGIETIALKNLDLKINKGDFIALMGPSGSGKSTLLHVLGCLLAPTSGEYFYSETPIHSLTMSACDEFRKKHISFIFQQFALIKYKFYQVHTLLFQFFHFQKLLLKIYKIVHLFCVNNKLHLFQQIKEIADEVMNKFGIYDIRNKKATAISGGQQQRCAIARAFASGNELILADEPTGALDTENSNILMNEIEKVHELGRTIIMATHDKGIASFADKIIEIKDGKIVN